MNTKPKYFIQALLILLILTSCSVGTPNANPIFYNQLIITGDVETELILDMFTDSIPLKEFKFENGTFMSFNLTSLFTFYEYQIDDYDVLFISNDGMKNKVSEGFELITIYLSETGWNVHAPDFPPTIALKNLKSVVFVRKDPELADSFNIITSSMNVLSITPGEMHLMNLEIFNYFDGTSTKNNNSMDAYKAREVLPLNKLIPVGTSIVVMTRDGGYYPMESEGYLELHGNQLNYLNPNRRLVIFDVIGIMQQPPAKSIMDAYHDALQFIDIDKKVMVIYIDGFSFGQYNYAMAKNHVPFLSRLSNIEMALAVYKPVTNSGMAALITGEPPHINGIKDRNSRDPKVETIFDYIESNGKSSKLIEGNASILNLNTNTILNPDQNNNGYTDDEVFKSAINYINTVDYMMVHFHGLDDSGHTYGALSQKTMTRLMEIDSYVESLVSSWDGMIIITSDHGMHNTDTGGDHGVFRYEDMIVPYIITKGGIGE